MEIIGYSKALYSTWFYAPEIRTLFDAGEGVNCVLAARLAGIRNVVLSHGHTDHFTGLMNVIITRMRLTAGEPEPPPPLRVYYPKGDRALEGYIDYLRRYFGRFERRGPVVEWFALEPGARIPITERRKLDLVAFATDHTPDVTSLGYNVVETRMKLNPDLEGLSPREVGAIVAEKGRDAVVHKTEHKVLSFSGDTRVLQDLPCGDSDLLIHEATFLSRNDADTQKHAILGELCDLLASLQPKRVLLYHYSTRYRRREIDGALAEQRERAGLSFEIANVYPGVLRWEGQPRRFGIPGEVGAEGGDGGSADARSAAGRGGAVASSDASAGAAYDEPDDADDGADGPEENATVPMPSVQPALRRPRRG